MRLACVFLIAGCLPAAEWYVSTTGSALNSGTAASPWSLAYIHTDPMPAAIDPGDTIWLRGGTYTWENQAYVTGTGESTRVTVRAYPGESVTIDALNEDSIVLGIAGAYADYIGIRFTNSHARTLTTWPVACYPNCRGGGVILMGPNNRLINCVIDNTGDGVSIFAAGMGSQAIGNKVLFVGWESALRGHGHGFYLQNDYTNNGNLRSRIEGNVAAYGHKEGFNPYGSAGSFVDGIYLVSNVAYNNAMLAVDSSGYSYFLGGNAGPKNITVVDNVGWYPSSFVRSGGLNTGDEVAADNLTITGNYFAGTTSAAYDLAPTNVTNSGNLFYGAFAAGVDTTFSGDTFAARASSVDHVKQWWNPYVPGTGYVVCINPSGAANCTFTPTGLLSGDVIEVRDSLDPLGAALTTFTYSGDPVSITMSLGSIATPVAPVSTAPVSNGTAFKTFLLQRQGTASAKSMTWRGSTADVIEYGYRAPSGIVWGGVPKPSISCTSGACTASVVTTGEAYFRINGSMPFRSL
jgi:hypothetical protein